MRQALVDTKLGGDLSSNAATYLEIGGCINCIVLYCIVMLCIMYYVLVKQGELNKRSCQGKPQMFVLHECYNVRDSMLPRPESTRVPRVP